MRMQPKSSGSSWYCWHYYFDYINITTQDSNMFIIDYDVYYIIASSSSLISLLILDWWYIHSPKKDRDEASDELHIMRFLFATRQE